MAEQEEGYQVQNNDSTMEYRLYVAQAPVFACCDFVAQSILIYRCWIVWDHNICVVIIPSLLAFAFVVIWIASSGAEFIQEEIQTASWGNTLVLTSLTVTVDVNALATGLIVFRIVKQQGKLRPIILVIIESGLALLTIQLARVVVSATEVSTDAENDAFVLIACIHEMLNGITPTIILVRVSMGLRFHDEPSLVEAIGCWQCGTDNLDPIPRMGSIDQDESLHEFNSGNQPQ